MKYPNLIVELGLTKMFWAHASIMMVGTIFVYFAMPETRGLTLTQLNEIFGGKVSYEEVGNKPYDIKSSFVDLKGGKLNNKKDITGRTSSLAALSKVASVAAISRVASLALSLGGRDRGT